MFRAPVLRTCFIASVMVVAAAATAAATVACSVVTKVDYAECKVNADCRGAFGLGSVCGEEGLCEPSEVEARCKRAFPEDLLTNPERYTDVIVLGSLLNHNKQSGDLLMVNAATLAVQGAASGLPGARRFGIVHCDYQEFTDDDSKAADKKTSEEAAVDGAKYLVDTLGAVAIIGPGTSGLAEVVYRELQLPEHAPQALMISPSATSVSLTNIDVRNNDEPGLFWRTAPPDSQLGAELAGRMTAEGITSATIIFESGPYGSGLALALDTVFAGELEQLGFEKQPGMDPLKDLKSLVDQVSKKTADTEVGVVFIGSEVEQVTTFINRASVFPFYQNVKIFLGDTARAKGVLEGTTDSTTLYPNIRGVFPGTPSGPVYMAFLADYKTTFKQTPDSFAALTYDATWLALYGAAWAEYQRKGKFTGLDLAYGLQHVSGGKNSKAINVTSGTWNDVKSEFQAGRSINITGVSGDLDYDPETEECTAPFSYWKIKADGKGFEDIL